MIRLFSFILALTTKASAFSSLASMPPITPIQWQTPQSIRYCITQNTNKSVNLPLISHISRNAIDNINLQTSSGFYSPLSFYIDDICQPSSFFIKLVDNTDNDISAAFCTRKYDFTRTPPAYHGCNITMNICILRNAATFYNVILHEFLHAVGLDHPNPPIKDAIISTGITKIGYNSSQYRLHNDYKQLSNTDVRGIQSILKRDFRQYYYPYQHYTIKTYAMPDISILNHKVFEKEIIDMYKC
jgi:hypothetical protein